MHGHEWWVVCIVPILHCVYGRTTTTSDLEALRLLPVLYCVKKGVGAPLLLPSGAPARPAEPAPLGQVLSLSRCGFEQVSVQDPHRFLCASHCTVHAASGPRPPSGLLTSVGPPHGIRLYVAAASGRICPRDGCAWVCFPSRATYNRVPCGGPTPDGDLIQTPRDFGGG